MLLPLLVLACANPNRETAVTGELRWEPCPLRYEDEGRPWAQCVTADLPLWWDDPEGETIEVFAQRRLPDQEVERQLWMLAGGPGQSATVYEEYVLDLQDAIPGTEILLYEHRGVGRSTRLSCPDQEADGSEEGIDVSAAEWPDCLAAVQEEWGEDLAAFSVDAAAFDLEHLLTQAEGEVPVFVYGGSYGTTLGWRFLQHFPDRVDGVVLDSLAVDVDHRVYDQEFDLVGRAFLEECGQDERCAEALGADPVATAEEIVAAVADGHCAEALDVQTLRAGTGAFLSDVSMRGYAPALFHRAGRCTEDDREDIRRLVSLFEDREPHYTERLYSPVLFANIELSEQWPEPWPSQEELEAVVDDALFSFAVGPAQRPLLEDWPRYALDPVVGQPLVTDTPVLMLQGGLDPQTPEWRSEGPASQLQGPGQHLVLFPQGAHILVGSTPAKGGDCATRIVEGFLLDPLAAPDDACVEEIEDIRFRGQPITSWLLFSDCSRYGNGCGGRRQDAALLLGLVGLLGWRRRR